MLLTASVARADVTEIYKGEAKKDGKLVYTEKHTVSFDDSGNVLSAFTEYRNPRGELVATIKSDFKTSLTAPDHRYEDFRNKNVHGIRSDGSRMVLYNKDFEKPEKLREINPAEYGDRLMVGCQGLHYYLRKNMEQVNEKRKLPILFFIPGLLDSYKFELEYKGEKDDIVSYEIQIENKFLRLFAPKLEVKYDKKLKRIIWYRGLSNINDDRGKTQTVEITYQYGFKE
jgi:hypothetical protein